MEKDIEGLRRQQSDQDSQSKGLKESANQARDSAVKQAREEFEKAATMSREVKSLQKSGETMRKSLHEMQEKIMHLNNIIEVMKAENDDLKTRLSAASKGVPDQSAVVPTSCHDKKKRKTLS